MSVRSGQTVTVDFTTRDPATAALADADSTPAGVLVKSGTDDAATVTITNKATGIYKAAVTLPTLAAGDTVQLRIAATVGGVSDTDVIWEDAADLAIDASGHVTVGTNSDKTGYTLDAGERVKLAATQDQYAPAKAGDAMTLADGAITEAKIADGAFTAAKFADGAFNAVWSVTTRTLSSFGTFASDVATAVWGAATRTLTGKAAATLAAADVTGNLPARLADGVTHGGSTAVFQGKQLNLQNPSGVALIAYGGGVQGYGVEIKGGTQASGFRVIGGTVSGGACEFVSLADGYAAITGSPGAGGYVLGNTFSTWLQDKVDGTDTASDAAAAKAASEAAKAVADKLDTMVVETAVGSGDYQFDTAAMANAPAGGGGGGGLTAGQQAQLDAIEQKTALLGTGEAVVVNSAVSLGGKIDLYKGEDRVAAAGNALSLIDADGTNLPAPGSAIRFEAVSRKVADDSFVVTGTVTEPGDGSRIASFDVPASSHSTLSPGAFDYFVWELSVATWRKLEYKGVLVLHTGMRSTVA